MISVEPLDVGWARAADDSYNSAVYDAGACAQSGTSGDSSICNSDDNSGFGSVGFYADDVDLDPRPQLNHGAYLPFIVSNTVQQASPAAATIVPQGATWLYLDDGTFPGADWLHANFDDSGWKSGPAPLGYGDAIQTVVDFGPEAEDKFITTYFRHAFYLANPAAHRSFRLLLKRDDGAVVYLNGVEVYRSNMPLGAINYQTLAVENIGGAAKHTEHEAIIDASLFAVGRNVLAVEIHQSTPNSSDTYFDLAVHPANSTTLVPLHTQWAFQDSGEDLGLAWRNVGFNDSKWATGIAPLGYGDRVNTIVSFGPDAANKHVTTYFRHTFDVAIPSLYERMVLTLRRDDGAAVYLNGEEVLRDNLAEDADYQTYATRSIAGIEETTYLSQTLDPALLRAGKNVLAVEVHQTTGTSSDLTFDLSLRAIPISDGVHFAVIGDFGNDSHAQFGVAQLLASWAPDFVLSLGDSRYNALTYDTAVGQYYCAYLKEIEGGPFCAGNNGEVNRFFPATGNHDYSDGGAIKEYAAYFKALPGTGIPNPNPTGSIFYYDFVRGPVHFFVVDSELARADAQSLAAQQAWLEQSLTTSTAPWQVVFFHHPPYSSNQHGSDAIMQWPYAAWGADLLLSGHDHAYERIERDGIVYIVNGAGGATLRPFVQVIAGSEARNHTVHGAQWIMADDCNLWSEFVASSGQVIDQFGLTKDNCN